MWWSLEHPLNEKLKLVGSIIYLYNALSSLELHIPVVQILIEGGYDVLKQADLCVSQGIPIIICKGTGRVADILVKALEIWRKRSNVWVISN